MAMSARILLIFCFLVACQEGPQLALDPVADGSVDAGPEALELTRLWVTALPPLPAIHFEEERPLRERSVRIRTSSPGLLANGGCVGAPRSSQQGNFQVRPNFVGSPAESVKGPAGMG